MGDINITCDRCSKTNEFDLVYTRKLSGMLTCWNCGAELDLSKKKTVKKDDISRFDVSYINRDKKRLFIQNYVLNRITIFAIVAILGVIFAFYLLSPESELSYNGSQFRAKYHMGEGIPSGNVTWQKRLFDQSGLSPARSGDLIIFVGNSSIAKGSTKFRPIEVNSDVIPRLRKLHKELLLQGYRFTKKTYKTALANGQRERFAIPLEKGECYNIAVFSSESSRDVGLSIYENAKTDAIITDIRSSRDANVEYCSKKTTTYDIEVNMRKGFGVVNILIYRLEENNLNEKGFVYAIDSETGDVEWESRLTEQISSAPSAMDDYIVLGTLIKNRSNATGRVLFGGSIQVLSSYDGSILCSLNTPGPVYTAPIVDREAAFFGSCGSNLNAKQDQNPCKLNSAIPGRFYSINVRNCAKNWSIDIPTPIVSDPVRNDRNIYFSSGSKLYALDMINGETIWYKELTGTLSSTVVEGDLVIVGSSDRTLRAFRADNGNPVWIFSSDTSLVSTPAIYHNVAYSGGHNGSLYAIDLENGQRIWDIGLPGTLESPIAVVDHVVYVLTPERLTAVNSESGSIVFQFVPDAPFLGSSSPIVVNGKLYITDLEGNAYAVE